MHDPNYSNSYQGRHDELKEKIQQKKMQKHDSEVRREQIDIELLEKEMLIQRVRSFREKPKRLFKRMKSGLRIIVAVCLGRRDPRQLYSVQYKLKFEQNKLKHLKEFLYQYGIQPAVIQELTQIVNNPRNKFQRAIAEEMLIQWYVNQSTDLYAIRALELMDQQKLIKKDEEYLRKRAILKAECMQRTGNSKEAIHLIESFLQKKSDPDLYLALANLAENNEDKVNIINKALSLYGLNKINLQGSNEVKSYDHLEMKASPHYINSSRKVTIIVPTYNVENGLSSAIQSIINQTWLNLEVIIVDDQSTDCTFELAKEYERSDQRIKVMQTPTNSGPYVARNIGLTNATGEFVTVNDADDWSHDQKIELQAQHLIDHPDVIANTSEHARLTEELNFFRRGLFGQYIFSNMSSLMFRKDTVLNEIGYWDVVRFAGDGEYKRRLIKVFGKDKIIDLNTGPLSFPRQATGSLTSNSAFGYDGHFKGARKEYVESFERYHKQSDSLKYPFNSNDRLFPVPKPMLVNNQNYKHRNLDFVIAADFRNSDDFLLNTIIQLKEKNIHLGIVQMSEYHVKAPAKMHESYRSIIDGEQVEVLVYGEDLTCNILWIYDISILLEQQEYFPNISSKSIKVTITKLPSQKQQVVRLSSYRLLQYFGEKGKWYPIDQTVRQLLLEYHANELKNLMISNDNWRDFWADDSNINNMLESHFIFSKGDR